MYFGWSIDFYDRHGNFGRRATGVLKASDEDSALELLWMNMGNDNACRPRVWPLDLKNNNFIEL